MPVAEEAGKQGDYIYYTKNGHWLFAKHSILSVIIFWTRKRFYGSYYIFLVTNKCSPFVLAFVKNFVTKLFLGNYNVPKLRDFHSSTNTFLKFKQQDLLPDVYRLKPLRTLTNHFSSQIRQYRIPIQTYFSSILPRV